MAFALTRAKRERRVRRGVDSVSRTTRTPEKDGRFFAALSDGASVSKAARRANYGRASVYADLVLDGVNRKLRASINALSLSRLSGSRIGPRIASSGRRTIIATKQ